MRPALSSFVANGCAETASKWHTEAYSMFRRSNRYLRLALRILLALTVCTFAIAQNTPAATSPTTNNNQAPATAQPAPNTREPANQAAPSQNPPAAGQDQPQEASGQDQGRFVFKKQVQEV